MNKVISFEEKKLLDTFRQLDDRNKETILILSERLVERQELDEEYEKHSIHH